MKNRLRHWWNTPGVWTICFALLFDRDVATIDFERDFDVFNLVDIFITQSPHGKLRIVYPEVFTIISAMLDIGLRAIVRDRNTENEAPKPDSGDTTVTRGRRRTMSLNAKQPTIGNALDDQLLKLANTYRHARTSVGALKWLRFGSELCYPVSLGTSLTVGNLSRVRLHVQLRARSTVCVISGHRYLRLCQRPNRTALTKLCFDIRRPRCCHPTSVQAQHEARPSRPNYKCQCLTNAISAAGCATPKGFFVCSSICGQNSQEPQVCAAAESHSLSEQWRSNCHKGW